jgi:hypothetical protein
MAKITVSGVSSLKGVNYRRVQVNKIDKVCATCGNRIPSTRPYGTIYVPASLKDLDEITIRVLPGEEDDHVGVEHQSRGIDKAREERG